MIGPWTQGQANFADDLRPHMQSCGRVFPFGKSQSWPRIGYAIHIRFFLSPAPVAASLWDARCGPCSHPRVTLRTAKRLQEDVSKRCESQYIVKFRGYSRLIKSEKECFTLSNIPRASSCVR